MKMKPTMRNACLVQSALFCALLCSIRPTAEGGHVFGGRGCLGLRLRGGDKRIDGEAGGPQSWGGAGESMEDMGEDAMFDVGNVDVDEVQDASNGRSAFQEGSKKRKKRSRRRQDIINRRKDKRGKEGEDGDMGEAWEKVRGAHIGDQQGPDMGDKIYQEATELEEKLKKENEEANPEAAARNRFKVEGRRRRMTKFLAGSDQLEEDEILEARRETSRLVKVKEAELTPVLHTEAQCVADNFTCPFDWLTLGDSMGITDENKTVVKLAEAESYVQGRGLVPVGTFALFGCQSHRPKISRWHLRIRHLSSYGSVGVLNKPYSPFACDADHLVSRAWILTSDGLVIRTGRAGREELNGRASASVPCQDDITFGTGSILSMTMDRNSRRLSVEVNSGPSVTFTSIDPDAIPFVNLRGEDDAVEIITAEQAREQMKKLRKAIGRRGKQTRKLGSKAKAKQERQLARERDRAKVAEHEERSEKQLPYIFKAQHKDQLFEESQDELERQAPTKAFGGEFQDSMDDFQSKNLDSDDDDDNDDGGDGDGDDVGGD